LLHPDSQFGGGDITDLHYTYLKKSNNLGGMFAANPNGCELDDQNGKISSWDMLTHTVDPIVDIFAKDPGSDQSTAYTPAGFPTAAFYGMAVIDDVQNLNGAIEGNVSGEVNIFNLISGTLLDYKLVNNHRSTTSGDFSVGFTRKSSVDLQWNPTNRDFTFWLGVATGANMTSSGSIYNGGMTISQNTRPGNSSPMVPHNKFPNTNGGVYNNDERNYSGNTPVNINCMGLFTRADFMNNSQQVNTAQGGWTRRSIVGDAAGIADGGLVYKSAFKIFPSIFSGRAILSFGSETSGHLAAGNEHPNRPY
jgi:hypothetical protein